MSDTAAFEVHARYAAGLRKGEWQAWVYDKKADAVRAFSKMVNSGEFIDDGTQLDRVRIMAADGKVIMDSAK